jgi:ribosomal protein L11 methylase PrmA
VPIDFHDAGNHRTYSGRDADVSWREAVAALVDPASADVVDVGCGGGAYTRAWHELGAATVTGVDFSGPILDAAREATGTCRESPSATVMRRPRASPTTAPTSCSSVR